MTDLSKKEVLQYLARLDDVRQKCAVIRYQLELAQAGKADFSERDLADFVAADVEANYDQYKSVLGEHAESEALVQYFYDHPVYLARALVQMYPDIFYMEGFAHRFVLKLNADLGPVLRRPARDFQESTAPIFLGAVTEEVRANLAALDLERRFRDYMYFFSRDPAFGLEQLDEDICNATSDYVRDVLRQLREYSVRLLDMTFPVFVEEIQGSLFPSFHVRWWIDLARQAPRVLNMGDTGTQKTAFAVVASHDAGCQKVLVLCPPHARNQWRREIGGYFRSSQNRVLTVRRAAEVAEALTSSAQYTVVGYTTATDRRAREQLCNVPFDALIWDESHYGKNVVGASISGRAEACHDLIQALPLQRILALSATPWENHPRELAAIASALRPDLFPKAEVLNQTRTFDPRLLRELFADHILDAELHEVVDLPPISPKPWEDLFGAESLDMSETHRAIYEFVRECDSEHLTGQTKVLRLLLATINPHCLKDLYDWPAELRHSFSQPELSTKLMWIKDRVTRELRAGAKVVIATGIYVRGITTPQEGEEEAWIAQQLRAWFGQEQVLILDGRVSQAIDRAGVSKRDQVVARWRSDPNARILLVSMRACPDAINLSVPKLPGVTKLFLTTFSFPWVPWKQFLGRFWRAGLGVPFSYAAPVLRSTVDENLYELVRQKWELQQLFRAQVPLTEHELELFDHHTFLKQLAPDCWSSCETVNFMGRRIRECGEGQIQQVLAQQRGLETNATRFANAFVRIQDYTAPGHIARFMQQVITAWVDDTLVCPERILDAGCGPLTLERVLNLPVYGVDMNEAILSIGKALSPRRGINAHCGFLPRLLPEWQHMFELTVASLVVDWASLRRRTKAGVPMRLAMLQELVRVTHPTGRVWLTFTRRALDQELFRTWCNMLVRNEFKVLDALTGLVEAVDHKERPFAFWSLCFCPEGKSLVDVSIDDLALTFDRSRLVTKRSHNVSVEPGIRTDTVRHEAFVVHQPDGEHLTTQRATQKATQAEKDRIARLGRLPWRALLELSRRGVLDLSRKET